MCRRKKFAAEKLNLSVKVLVNDYQSDHSVLG